MFKIAIPTFNRPELKTYKLACDIIGDDNVFVFFHSQEDYAQYKQVIRHPIITNAERGVANNRNAILDFFEKDDNIVMMDDDIDKILKLKNNKLIELKPEEIKIEFEKAFQIT
jgi:hypothetical protein